METKIEFTNSNGTKLVGILSDPTGDLNKPIMVLCHGFASTKNTDTNLKLTEILNAKGIATFRFDFFGHGESEGNFSEITPSEGIDDAICAIKMLQEKGYTKIGIEGSSYGGFTALMTASKIEGLFVAALKCPVINYYDTHAKQSDMMREWKEKGYRPHRDSKGEISKLNYTFAEDFPNVDGYVAAENINVPVIIVHGDADELVNVEQSKKVAGIIKDCRLEVIQGANHRFTEEEHFSKMIKLLSEFIIEKAN